MLLDATEGECVEFAEGAAVGRAHSTDSGLATAVVIERRACSWCHDERPDPAEILIAARWLAGARPHLAAVAGMVYHEDLWQLSRDELTG